MEVIMNYRKGFILIPEGEQVDQFFPVVLPKGSRVLSVEKEKVMYTCPVDSEETVEKSFIILSKVEDDITFDIPEGKKLRKIGKITRNGEKMVLCVLKKKHICTCAS